MMNTQIEVRKAVSTDTAFIYQSLQESSAEQNLSSRFFLSTENLFSALFSEKAFAQAILAISNNQPVGVLLFSMTNHNFPLFNGEGIYIHTMYVDKQFRRNKIGTQLINEIKKIARERNCCRLDGVILKENTTAINFYKTIHDAKEIDYINYMRIIL